MLDFRDYECFCVLAKTLHFQSAADQLNISAPTLSRIINRVESQVGTKLFQRTTRSVALTPAGIIFYQKAVDLLELHQQTCDFYQQLPSGKTGKITITYGGLPIDSFLPGLLKRFKATYPEVELRLDLQRIDIQEAFLLDGTADIGFFSGTPRHSDLHYECIHKEPLLFITAADGPYGQHTSISAGEIAQLDMILGKPDRWVDVYEDLFRFMAAKELDITISQHADDVASVMAFVTAGLGHSVMPKGEPKLARKGIVYLPIDDFDGQVRLNAVWRRNRINPVLENLKAMLHSSPETNLCSQKKTP